MKNTLKKLVSLTVIALTTLQMGCAHTKTLQVSSLDEIQFKSGYHYEIDSKSTQAFSAPGPQISTKNNKLSVQRHNKLKLFDQNDIVSITAIHDDGTGSKALSGLAWGGAAGAGTGFFLGTIFHFATKCSDPNDEWCNHSSYGHNLPGILYFSAIMAGVGGLIGAGIGALIPKHEKVKFIPIVDTGKNVGTTTGGSIEMKF